MPSDPMDVIVNLAKRRGFAFQSSEIYGGIRSSYDYGPLGVELKNNIKKAWWRSIVQLRDDVVGQDAAIIMAPGSGRRPGTWSRSPTRWSSAPTVTSASARTT